jgi:hypothetical protein
MIVSLSWPTGPETAGTVAPPRPAATIVGSECLRPRAAAMRDIKVEEELTFDYGKLHAEMHKLHDNVAGR